MRKMNTIKRIVAFSLAVIMIVLAPLQHANAYVIDRTGNSVVDTTNNLIAGEDISYDREGFLANLEGFSTSNGVMVNDSPYEGNAVNGFIGDGYTLTEIDWAEMNIDLKLPQSVEEQLISLDKETIKADDLVPVIIEFDSNSILEANSDAKANGFTALKSKVMGLVQSIIISRIENKVFGGKELEITNDYTWVVNGVATAVPFGSIGQIKEIKGVREVYIQRTYEVADYERDEVSVMTEVGGTMIGREDAWEAFGYTGKGIKIAVIDTGIDNDHPSFAALPESALEADAVDIEYIDSVLTQLNAYEMYPNVTGEKLYYNTKIAYGFNYADGNLSFNHDNDSQGDHGTHVAGIAAANKLETTKVVGVAPDAQLIIMKVFGAYGGGTTGTLLTAIEDALILDVDVINMSVGAACGFSTGGDVIDAVYERVGETDTFLSISAGNSGASSQGNALGTDANFTSDPDYSTTSQPSTYENAVSVASVNNMAFLADYIEVGGEKVRYVASTYPANSTIPSFAEAFGDEDLDFVMVGNLGKTLEDFTSANVAGKVAVVSRGEVNFTQKWELAEAAGAIACIIYNNVPNEEMGADLSLGSGTIPCISVTMETGAKLQALADEGKATFYVGAEQDYLPYAAAYEVSSFSSWGVTPDLQLKPDIAAPGGNIFSAYDDGQYGYMSGTSMAAPNVAGMAALVKQYVDEQFPDMTDVQKQLFVKALLVSTADPLVNKDGLYYSPRQQGTGLANVYDALATTAYLSVEGNDVPTVSLYDDPDKTGVYRYNFTVHNFGDTNMWYLLDTNAQTDAYYTIANVYEFNAMSPYDLEAKTTEYSDYIQLRYNYNNDTKVDLKDLVTMFTTDASTIEAGDMIRYDLDGDDTFDAEDAAAFLKVLVGKEVEGIDLEEKVLQVPAGEDVEVSVKVELTEEDVEYIEGHFENGIYVEGFTFLNAIEGESLSLPYLAFYGDWTEAPIFDSAYYWNAKTTLYSQYPHVLWTYLGANEWQPGLNPYISEAFDPAHISVSPNGDGYMDIIDDVYLSLMRNVRTLKMTYLDAETNEIYYQNVAHYCMKSYYMDAYQMIVPYVVSWDVNSMYDFTDDWGEPLANGTEVILRFEAELDYEGEQKNDFATMEFVIKVDTEAPEIVASELVREGDKLYLDLTISDSTATAAIIVTNKTGQAVKDIFPAEKGEPGEEIVNRIDVTGMGDNFMVVLGDYAGNERGYSFMAEDNDPAIYPEFLYGYRISDQVIQDDSLFGWLAVRKTDAAVATMSSEYYMDYALQAAAYVDGNIIAIDANKQVCIIKPGYWDERKVVAQLPSSLSITQLAFDATTGTLYGYNNKTSGYYGQLVKFDLDTFETTIINSGSTYTKYIRAMAFDDNGVLYGINNNGKLVIIDHTTGTVGTETLASLSTGSRSYGFSMTYDSTEDVFYVADLRSSGGYKGTLVTINPANAYAVTEIGTIGGNSQLVGLLMLDDKGYSYPDKEITDVTLPYEELVMVQGQNKYLDVVLNPWYSEEGELSWTSSNAEIVSVNNAGNVVAHAIGSASVTVNVTVDGEVVASATCAIEVLNPDVDFEAYTAEGDYPASWISFNGTALNNYIVQKPDYTGYLAGEYYDGTIYAFSYYSEMYKIDAATKDATKISDVRTDIQFLDMTYDYTNGWMYAVGMNYMTGNVDIVRVDLITGDFITVCHVMDEQYGYPNAIACATDGTMYAMSTSGFLCTIDVDDVDEDGYTGMTPIGFSGVMPSMAQCSLAYDHNNGGLYFSLYGYGFLYVDPVTGEAVSLGLVNGQSQLVSLYTVIEEENIPERETVEVTEIRLTDEHVVMIQGTSVLPPLSVLPFNATERNIDYVVEDETVVKVIDGFLYANAAGETKVQASVNNGTPIEFEVKVVASAGEIRGFVLTDLALGMGGFWGSFFDNDLANGMALAFYEPVIYAAEAVSGDVYAYTQNDMTYEIEFVRQTWDEYTGNCTNEVFGAYDYTKFPDVRDMAFDYSQGSMYAIAGVRNSDTNTSLYNIDMTTGQLYKLGDMDALFIGLTCSTDGQLYGVTDDGDFCLIDKTNGESEVLFNTGFVGNMYQSMAYDHDTGNIYWAQIMYDMWEGIQDANLVYIDLESEEAVAIGKIGAMGCEVVGLYIPTKHVIRPAEVALDKILLDKTSIMMEPYDEAVISATGYPIQMNAPAHEFTFTSSDEDVVTVDEDGVILAVGQGSATITVTSGDVSATCEVNVLGSNYKIHAMNTTGVSTANVLETQSYESEMTFAESDLVIKGIDYSEVDECYYAIDAEGYLWTISKDGQTIVKVSETRIIELYEDFENVMESRRYTIDINDIVVNEFNNKVYVIAQFYDLDYNYAAHVFELDKTTAVPTEAGFAYVNNITEFEFIGEKDIVYYDGMLDMICGINLDTKNEDGDYTVTQLAWVQATMSADNEGCFGMDYCRELNTMFFVTCDGYNNYDPDTYEALMAIYAMDMETKYISKLADTPVHTYDLRDIYVTYEGEE